MLFLLLLAAQEAPIHSARDCPEVFGDLETVEANREYRRPRLNFVIDGERIVFLDHSENWSEPEEIVVRSLELVDTSTDGGSTALVAFDAGEEGIDCSDGLYAVSADDALGEDGRVLAVLREALLIEIEGQLWYLRPEGSTAPDFRMSWSSRYSMNPYRASKRATLKKPARRRRKRRR